MKPRPDIFWLSSRDVEAVGILPSECIDLVRKTMEWHGQGLLEAPGRLGVHPPKGRHINAMPAFVPPLQAAGMKWVADFPPNNKSGLPTIFALLILNDPETGVPLCVMEAASLTAMRTSAMTSVCLQVSARPDASVATIVGTGVEALFHVMTLPKALPALRTFHIVGRDLQKATRFCTEVGSKTGVELIPTAERESAVRSADVIVTVTNNVTARLLELEWISPGATVVVLDNGGKETTLLHSMDRVIVDDRRPFASNDLRHLFTTGIPNINADLGEILTRGIPGRQNAQERILVLTIGFAGCDVAIATEVFQRARKMKLGTAMEA